MPRILPDLSTGIEWPVDLFPDPIRDESTLYHGGNPPPSMAKAICAMRAFERVDRETVHPQRKVEGSGTARLIFQRPIPRGKGRKQRWAAH